MSVYASGARGSSDQLVISVALKHDLAIIADLPHVWSIFVQTHGPYQEHLPVLDEAWERAKDFFAPRRHSRPIAEETLGGVVAFKHVTVVAFKLAHHTVV